MKRVTIAWISAVLCAYGLAAVTATQSVLARLEGMGVHVARSERIRATLADLAGLAPTLLPLVAGGFLVAMIVAALLARRLPRLRTALCALAGGVALVVIHLALKATLGITPVPIARTVTGLLVQGLAGAIGGAVFAVLTRRRRAAGR